jgi:outer membrane receptor protein involved in Fe transport
LRLSSKSTTIAGIATTWTAGLYYADQHRRFLDDEYIPGLQATYQQIYGYGINSPQSVVGPTYYAATPAYPGVSFANDLIYFGHTYPIQRQIAPFGEMGFEITPALKGTVGLRYVSAKSSEAASTPTDCRRATPTAKNSARRRPNSRWIMRSRIRATSMRRLPRDFGSEVPPVLTPRSSRTGRRLRRLDPAIRITLRMA